MNSTMRLSSSRSNQVPCPLQTSTITPEQRAKLIRFINFEHSGHGTYFTLLVSRTTWVGAGDASPSTADCCSRSAQSFSNEATSSQRPRQRSHSRTAVAPIVTNNISLWQRGHLRSFASLTSGTVAAAPQHGQCLLPMNIIAKHEGQATVARREPQNWQRGVSVDEAAPQFGQLSVSARIDAILPAKTRKEARKHGLFAVRTFEKHPNAARPCLRVKRRAKYSSNVNVECTNE